MDYERFVRTVADAVGASDEQAEQAIRATLQTLGERINGGEARDLAARLPPEVAGWLPIAGDAVAFDVDEFVRRVAEREGVDPDTAERHVRAVFVALGQTVGADEVDDLAAQLSRDYAPLLVRGPAIEVVPADVFLGRVAERAKLDRDGARRATEAVLETLAERIAGGEVDDLRDRLALELHAPLDRGVARTGGQATRMSLEEFVERVAEREGVDDAQALDHARAVFATLHEAVGDEEFLDVTVQLPERFVTALT